MKADGQGYGVVEKWWEDLPQVCLLCSFSSALSLNHHYHEQGIGSYMLEKLFLGQNIYTLFN